jgi:hypothetical protein
MKRLLATAAACALALSGGALAATYPLIPGPAGTWIPPSPGVVVGYDYASGAPCIVGQAPTCVLTSGREFLATVTPTLQTAAYASGNCMGGFQAIPAARAAGGSGVLSSLALISNGGSAIAKQIYVFSANPGSSTCVDRASFSIAAADRAKLVTTFQLTPAAPSGATWSEAEQANLARSFVTGADANLYVAIVETGAETPASTSDLVLTLGGVQD